MRKRIYLVLLTLLVISQLWRPDVAYAAATPDLKQAAAATALIVILDENDQVVASGSGSVLTPDGLVLTNYHVVKENPRRDRMVVVRIPKTAHADKFNDYFGKVLEMDKTGDLAIIRIMTTGDGEPISADAQFQVIPIADSNQLEVGDKVYALGYPDIAAEHLVVTSGMVSGFMKDQGLDWIMSDVVISNGNSGGMVINEQGELVAIPTLVVPGKISKATLAYFRPINAALPLLERAKQQQVNADASPTATNVLFKDDFHSNSNKWKLGKQALKDAECELQITGGKLKAAANFRKGTICGEYVPKVSAKNFELSIDATLVKNTSKDNVAFIFTFRATKTGDYYAVMFASNGRCVVGFVSAYDGFKSLAEPDTTDAFDLAVGKTNTFKLQVVDNQIIIFANDQEIATAEDATLDNASSIAFGVIGADNSKVIATYDNLLITPLN